jgi:hypothetical protein
LEEFVTLQPRPLKSRFGRRLLVLFVGCAVIPIALVASISYRHATRHLEAQSAARLDHSAEALGHAMFERLLLLDATLKSIPPWAIAQLLVPNPPPPPAAGARRSSTTAERGAGPGRRASPPAAVPRLVAGPRPTPASC